jgi:hypothetical protein
MRKSGDVTTFVVEVNPTQGALRVPSPPVPLMMGQPLVMAVPQSFEGIA